MPRRWWSRPSRPSRTRCRDAPRAAPPAGVGAHVAGAQLALRSAHRVASAGWCMAWAKAPGCDRASRRCWRMTAMCWRWLHQARRGSGRRVLRRRQPGQDVVGASWHQRRWSRGFKGGPATWMAMTRLRLAWVSCRSASTVTSSTEADRSRPPPPGPPGRGGRMRKPQSHSALIAPATRSSGSCAACFMPSLDHHRSSPGSPDGLFLLTVRGDRVAEMLTLHRAIRSTKRRNQRESWIRLTRKKM